MSESTEELHARVLTVSASYGAGGSVVAPAVADRLGLAFFDRLLHGPETHSADHILERLSEEERQHAPPGRIASHIGHLSAGLGFSMPTAADVDPLEEMRHQVEASILRIASTSGGVILGRGATVVLAGNASTFHVRLDGPVERRIAQGMAIEGVPEAVAREHQVSADRAWARFGQRVFKRDFTGVDLYHLVLDSTALALPDCVAVIATAATAYWEPTPTR